MMAQATKSTPLTTATTTTTNASTTTTWSLQGLSADQSNEAPYRDWEMVNDESVSLESTSMTTPKSEKPKRRNDPNYHYVEGEIPLESVIISSTLASKNNLQQTERIVSKFNEGIDTSKVYYDDPIRGKRVEPGFYKIYSWNNEAVIVPPSDQMVARVLYPIDVTQQVTSHGLVSQNSAHIVNRGKHVVMVPQGFIAKASIGNNLIFLGQGPHVIKDANFIFNADTGLVSLNEEYISHGTYHIISVPSGKIAKIILDGVPELLPSRSAPYVFNNSRFQIIKEGASYFEIATKKLIIHGSIKRLIVDTGEVAMISNNGKLEIIEPKTDISEPIIINSEYVRVNPDPFVSTNLQTIIFPQGKNVYESAQTADGVLVKMKLMITYRIKDPMLAIQQLNTPAKILEHIEYCALTDMRNATQSCNYYAIQQSESSRAPQGTQQYYQHIQDELKAKLKDELLLIGVDLGRLAFEEFVIDDKRVQDQRSSNAQAIANTTAQVSNMEQERTLKLQTEETKLQVSRLHLEQAKLAEISRAQVDFEKSQIMMKQENLQVEAKALQENMKIKYKVENENAMKLLEAQNKLEVARLEAEAKRVMAESDRDVMRYKGEVYQQYPQLFQLELAKIQAAAIAGVQTNIISPEVAQNLMGQLGSMSGAYLYPQQPQFAFVQQQQQAQQQVQQQASQKK